MNAREQARIELSHWRQHTPRTLRDAELDRDCAQWADAVDNVGAGAGAMIVLILIVWLVIGGLIERGWL